MNFFLVKGAINFIVCFALFIALLTRLQIHGKTPAFLCAGNPPLVKWHRWAGWITLGGFVLNRVISSYVGESPPFPLKLQHYAHGVFSALCAVAFLNKIRVTQREAKWAKQRVLTWGTTTFILGTSFYTLTFALSAWRWTNPPVTWGKDEWLTYQAARIGHVGLAVALIFLGRLALKNRPGRKQKDTFSRGYATGGNEKAESYRAPQVSKYKVANSISSRRIP